MKLCLRPGVYHDSILWREELGFPFLEKGVRHRLSMIRNEEVCCFEWSFVTHSLKTRHHTTSYFKYSPSEASIRAFRKFDCSLVSLRPSPVLTPRPGLVGESSVTRCRKAIIYWLSTSE